MDFPYIIHLGTVQSSMELGPHTVATCRGFCACHWTLARTNGQFRTHPDQTHLENARSTQNVSHSEKPKGT